MYLIKVKLDKRLGVLERRMQRLMEDMVRLSRPLISATGVQWIPEADMFETPELVLVYVSVAGVPREDIEVSFHDRLLSVRGVRRQNIPKDTPVRHHQLEIGYGNFERIFHMPTSVDPENIEAVLEDGILTITLRKKSVPRDVIVEIKT